MKLAPLSVAALAGFLTLANSPAMSTAPGSTPEPSPATRALQGFLGTQNPFDGCAGRFQECTFTPCCSGYCREDGQGTRQCR